MKPKKKVAEPPAFDGLDTDEDAFYDDPYARLERIRDAVEVYNPPDDPLLGIPDLPPGVWDGFGWDK